MRRQPSCRSGAGTGGRPRAGRLDRSATHAVLVAIAICSAGCRDPARTDQGTERTLAEIQATQERILARLDALERRPPAYPDGAPHEAGPAATPSPRAEPTHRPAGKLGETRGAATPSVTIVEYLDFASPECAAATRWTADILATHPEQVALEFRPFPTNRNPDARGAAKAAWAAAQQGRFWEMHDLLFANPGGLGEDRLRAYAQQLGLDLTRFDADRASAAAEGAVVLSKQSGNWAGLRAVPAILVNGKLIDGASADTVRREVETALRGTPRPATVRPPP